MFTLENVKRELEESKELPMTSRNAQDYAALLIIHDHLCGKGEKKERRTEWEEKEYGEAREKFSKDVAMKWVSHLKSDDPEYPTGPRWKPEEVRGLVDKVGVPKEGDEFWIFYAVMNAMYSDYYGVAKKYGLEKNPMYFADTAVAFIDDMDAVEDKVAMYYKYVVMH